MRARALLAAAALVIALPASTSGAQGYPPQPIPSFVKDLPAGGLAIPLINSGDVFNGTTFEGIPDGIGIMPVGDGSQYIDVFINFEQSHVPFSGFADHEDSSVQRARLDVGTKQIVKLREELPAKAGFIRFCSANMVGPDQGFPDYTFLTNEESNDVLTVPPGAPYGSDPSVAPYRQAGYSVWLDAKTGMYKAIPGAGRVNHENTVVVPGGWSNIVALTGDDTFAAPSSQLYMYSAANAGAFKQDNGSLWAFRVTSKNGTAVDPALATNNANDYLDMTLGDTMTGQFIPVPADYAQGTHGGNPQADLENWSNANNVFQFIRVEDIAYDPDAPRTVYFADTGSTVQPDLAGERMRSGGTAQRGRIFKMVLNPSNPTLVDSFTVFADGNNASTNFIRPDNVGLSQNGIMVQEDNSAPPGVPTDNDIWLYSFGTDSWTRVATVTQTAAETSGIVDASEWLGDGWWVFDIQSHSTQESFGTGSYTVPITNVVISGFTIRRELGQLSLLYIPGS
jgi:hypothetical protein